MQTRTEEEQMIEWMAAASSFGQYSDLEPLIEVNRHERGSNDTYEFPWVTFAIAYTGEGKKMHVHSRMMKDRTKEITDKDPIELGIGHIEHDCYSDEAAENRVRYLFQEYFKKTGVMRAKVNVWKKVFASNGRATVAVIIEDTLDHSEMYEDEQEP